MAVLSKKPRAFGSTGSKQTHPGARAKANGGKIRRQDACGAAKKQTERETGGRARETGRETGACTAAAGGGVSHII